MIVSIGFGAVRMRSFLTVFSFSILLVLTGCGITQPIRPLEEGATEIHLSLGGPIIPAAGIAFPVPYLNLGGAYGYKPNMTIFANTHLTALLFKDVGLDAGFSTRLAKEKGIRPEITLNGRGYFFWDAFRGSTTRFYPMGTLTASYRTDEHSLIYFGIEDLYQFSTSSMFLSPFIGYCFPAGEAANLQIESKWLAMNHDTRHGVFEGLASVGGKGNIGIFFGMQYRWK